MTLVTILKSRRASSDNQRGIQETRFITNFERYMRGHGHPMDPDGVYEGFYLQTRLDPNKPLFRARLFLAAITGSDIAPVAFDSPVITVG